jgi:Tfp pilus assembly PilM family ATPase
MPNILAIDWDRQEVRCVLASVTREQTKVLLATSVPLIDVAESGEEVPRDAAASLRSALAGQRLGRCPTIVGVHRAGVETLDLSLPPATDAELAALVLNQALREAQTFDGEASLDFLPMNDDPGQPRQVYAAVLSAATRQRIHETCAAAGLKPSRIVLRPLAAASLFARANAPLERVCLLVSMVADEADLTVLVEGRVVFLRTVRQPARAGEEAAAQRMSAEIARTLVVAQQGPLGGSPVERVYVYSGPGEHQTLVDQLAIDSGLAVTTVDPFESADVSSIELPGSAGRFASLLGMVVDESRGAHAMDFLHPRRPPRPPNRRRTLVVAAAILSAVVLAGGYYDWGLIEEENNTIAERRKELAQYNDLLKRQSGPEQLVEAIDNWNAGEIVWLDELRDLSKRFPAGRDAIVLRMSLSPGRRGGGNVELSGLVRDSAIVARIDRNLTDEYRTVRSRRVGLQERGKDLSWLFESSIAILPRDKEFYRDPGEAKP